MDIDTLNAISLKAKEIAEEFGADAVAIIIMRPTLDGTGWMVSHAAYMEADRGLDWETVQQVVHDAGDDMASEHAIDMPQPS